MESKTEDNYILGQSAYEYERLTFQAKILRPFTEKFFRFAGVSLGMRVLEIGSGMGDVAFLASEIVGPGGSVLGVDQDCAGLEKARERSRQQGCSSWVSFEGSNLAEFETADQFDAIVGRYILLYQQDPGAIIRRLVKFLKPGGIVVFQQDAKIREDEERRPTRARRQKDRRISVQDRQGIAACGLDAARQQLSDLDGVGRGALPQVVADDEHA